MEEAGQVSRIDRFELIYSTVITQEASADSIVPDYMPDVEKILLTDAKLLIRKKTVAEEGVELEGTVLGNVLYVGQDEEAGLQTIGVSVPISLSCEGSELEETDKLWISCRINAAEGRALNPRKISFRAEAAAVISVFRSVTADLTCDTREAGDAEILEETARIGYISGAEERTFTVSEELPLSDGSRNIWKLLCADIHTETEDVRKVGGKMILQGNTELSIVFTDEESMETCFDRFRIPFSQIVDAPEADMDACVVSVLPVSYSVEPYAGINGARSVTAEIRMTAQILTASRAEVTYSADAYNLYHPCIADKAETAVCEPYQGCTLRSSVRETVHLAEPAAEMLYTAAECSVPFASGDSMRVPVCCSLVYKTADGKLGAASKRLQAELPLGADPSRYFFGDAVCSEPAVLVQGDQAEIRFEVQLPAVTASNRTITFLSAVRTDGETAFSQEERPSVMAVRPGGRSLWTLAKQYCSTRELIAAANPDPVLDNPVVLIPRAR